MFPDAGFTVTETGAYWSKDQSTFLWTGKIAGMERGTVTVAITGEIVSANVSTDSGDFYWIRQVDGALHAVQQVELNEEQFDVDDAVAPPVQAVEEAVREKQRSPERLATVSRGATASVDVLVVYTPAARTAAGGTSAIVNKINLAIAEMNQGYVNSSVNMTVQLAAALEINYTEAASIDDDLDNLQGTNDGQMDTVHSLRNQYGADVVALLIQRASSGTVGIGFIMQVPGSYFANWAFSVTEQAYAAGPGYTLAHEIGHNMGSAHDRANSSNGGAYSYSYGYQGPTFRTIMAYACSGRSCPRINYWSNPSVSYSDSPTGVPSGQSNSADNAQSLNNTGSVVAAFRAAASGCTYSINPSSTTAGSSGGASSFTVTAGSGCSWTATTSSAWISITGGSSGTGNGTVSFTVQSNIGAARTGTITAAGQTFTVNQNAGTCSYSLGSSSASYSSSGGTGSIAVTAGSGCGWTASTLSSWISITSGSSGSGSGTVSYSVAANSGAARSGTITIGGQGFSVSQNASPGVSITITSNPIGRTVQVDGANVVTPQTFSWAQGSTHTVAASAQGSGTRYVFLSWSDGGAASHSITTPGAASTYTATFQTQYLLTASASPSAGGSVFVAPASGDGYYAAGTGITATANAAPGYFFAGWSGAVSGGANPAGFTMDAQKTITAGFTAQAGITIGSNPAGRTIVVDGLQYATPAVFQWTLGSFHTIDASLPQQAAGTKYSFSSWSDGGSVSHGITVVSGTTSYTASYATSYLLTTAVSPPGAGTVSLNPVSADGFYSSGTVVQASAAPAPGYQFLNWSGDAPSTSASVPVAMTAPRSLTANFGAGSVCTYSLSQSSATVLATGDLRQVDVTAGSSCAWTAVSNVSWITVVSGASGAGNGHVRFSVAQNTSTIARSGLLTIGGVTYAVNQSAASCTFTLTGPLTALPANATTFPVTINTQPGCQWTAYGYPSFLSASPGSGSGSGSVTVSLAGNSNVASRLGVVTIGGQFLQLLQQGSLVSPLFTDVPSNYLFVDYVNLLRLNGVTTGCGSNANAYCPEDVMVRTEMAAFIIRALFGESFSYTQSPYFTDVPANHPYFKYIQKMRDQGITVGCTATTYCPDGLVSRGQMAAFLVRARLGVTQGTPFPHAPAPYFTDVDPSHLFYSFIQKMKELGITSGCTTTSYCPENLVTRGQMSVFVNRSFLY